MDGPLRTALLGRYPRRTRVAVGAVVALTLVTYAVGWATPRLVSASVERLPLLVVVVVLGLGGVAAAIAYWADGFVVSLPAVFGPTTAWLWLFFTSGTGTVLAGTVAQVVGYATVTMVVVGPPAYVVGRIARVRRDGDASVECDATGSDADAVDRDPVVAALLGTDPVPRKRTAALAVALVPVGAGALWLADLLAGTSARTTGAVFFVVDAIGRGPFVGAAVVAVWLAVAGVATYRGRGLLGSVALVGGPLLGGNGYLFVSTGLSGAGPAVDAALALVAAATFTVALGVPGFVVGVAARRLTAGDASRPGGPEPET